MAIDRNQVVSEKHVLTCDSEFMPIQIFLKQSFWEPRYTTCTSPWWQCKMDSASYWNVDDRSYKMDKTEILHLKDCTIRFNFPYRQPILCVLALSDGRVINIESFVNTGPRWTSNRKYYLSVNKVTHDLIQFCDEKRYVVDCLKKGDSFEPIPDLFGIIMDALNVEKGSPIEVKLYYGLSKHKYSVEYKGRELRGSCYAVLIGVVAVLLKDDFSFDSLVLLKGATPYNLDVAKVIYSVNTHVIKVIVSVG